MTKDDDATFLGRWSRRKRAARAGEPLEEPPAPQAPQPAGGADARAVREREGPPAAGPGQPPPAPSSAPLPEVESLRGLASEYRDFLQPGVDDGTRRAALKKLFADPHFNRMDGLDVYIDDYSLPDPIPNAMLRKLAHAKELLFGEEDRHADSQTGATGAPPPPGASGTAAAPAGDAALQQDQPSPPAEGGDAGKTAGAGADDPIWPNSTRLSPDDPDPAKST